MPEKFHRFRRTQRIAGLVARDFLANRDRAWLDRFRGLCGRTAAAVAIRVCLVLRPREIRDFLALLDGR